ncbi:pseudouridylate synthase 7 homolog [Hylaeus anthracinus]|uniref:pseudouridylate synthase 7 homolog n=1 Tax=Hylaeus anthracinus TaxID=313031 RepID=UPI0023BA084B|nr:pseudouridylate synthase 7 homolog [Hylaeus anthracinus]
MSESKSVDSKDSKSEQESANSNARDEDQKNSRKDRRFNKDFRKNRGSHHGGYRNNNFGRKPFKRTWSDVQKGEKRTKMEVGSRLKECDVGITEFIGEKGFFGIIKERYSDFHVNEIALDGQIAKLTNQVILPKVEENNSLELLKNTISDTIWNELQKLKDPEVSSIEIDVTTLSKEDRRTIHVIASKITNVISQTIAKEEKKIIVIIRNKKDNSVDNPIGPFSQIFRKDNRVDWKKLGGEYCYFVLHKVNMDTMDALNQLAKHTRMKSNYFTYAGTKDRRAWTTQWVSVKKVEPSDILRAAKNVRGAYVGNFKFVKEPLKLGMLNGNRFRIALRNANGTDDQIEETMVSLRDNGFINYYGLQRFGTIAAIPTYAIGKALLQGKWTEAIELILKPRDGEQDRDLAEARKVYESTKNAHTAYKLIKGSDKIEASLLKGICSAGSTNPQGALDSIPRNIRLMYIHSYQSYVWNYMVSKRIKEFGRKPIVGDLVYEDNIKQNDNDTEDFIYDNDTEVTIKNNSEPSEKKSKFESEVSTDIPKVEEKPTEHTESTITAIKEVTDATECCIKIDDNTEQSNDTNKKDEFEDVRNLPTVKILKEEDLPNYTLADVLMPQVGWKVIYPPYAKPWFDEFLAKDGLTTDLRQKNKKYSLGGAYRKMLQVPMDVSWKIMHYKDKYSNLIMCDIGEMRKLTPPKDEPEGQYKALIVEMSLKASTYATMALREILKSDTSPEVQAAQFAACVTEAEKSDTSKNVAENENACSRNNNKNVDDERGSTVQEMESNDSNKTETGEQDDKIDVSDAM